MRPIAVGLGLSGRAIKVTVAQRLDCNFCKACEKLWTRAGCTDCLAARVPQTTTQQPHVDMFEPSANTSNETAGQPDDGRQQTF